MSRSVKKHPGGKYSDSDKEDKVAAHKKFRRSTKTKLKTPYIIDYTEPDSENLQIEEEYPDLPEDMREISDVWCFSSDGGSHYVGNYKSNGNKHYTEEVYKKWVVRK